MADTWRDAYDELGNLDLDPAEGEGSERDLPAVDMAAPQPTAVHVAPTEHERGHVWWWRYALNQAREQCPRCRPSLPCFAHVDPLIVLNDLGPAINDNGIDMTEPRRASYWRARGCSCSGSFSKPGRVERDGIYTRDRVADRALIADQCAGCTRAVIGAEAS